MKAKWSGNAPYAAKHRDLPMSACSASRETTRPDAPGKWVYPEVAVESGETGGPVGRDYDWSYYDVIYFQGDREPDVSSCLLAQRS